jgi:nucleoside-diphosphate-sugar epimerase
VKRLLITGARGFLGRHCLEPALAAGYEVVAATSGKPPSDHRPITWRQVDLLAPGAARDLVAGVRPSHVLHLAWTTEHGRFWSSPNNLDWLAASVDLVGAFGAFGGSRFVGAGSCAEYDWTTGGRMIEGVTRDEPATFYGRIKLAQHSVLMASAGQFGFSAATGRIFFLFGPDESPERLVPTACRRLIAGEVAAFSSGAQIRDFLHVRDAALGLVALLGSDIEGACNVSSGVGVTIRSIVETIGALTGRPDLIRFGALPDRPGEPAELVGDCSKLARTGWTPMSSTDAGLHDAVKYWIERRQRELP